ncbi:MAG: tetratricopeptide repeat protein [Chlorobi bacterium]|nr:tetratricopeptide repeat protein [Chlorobiota bacterium]
MNMLLWLCLPFFGTAGNIPPFTYSIIQSIVTIKQRDTARIHKLCSQAISLRRDDPEGAFAYTKEALSLSDSLDYLAGKAQAWHTLGRILHSNFRLGKAREAYHKADSLYYILNLPEQLADTRNKIGITYGMEGYYDSSLYYFQQSLELYADLGQRIKVANCQNNMGNVYKYLGKYDLSVDSYNKALQSYAEVNDSGGIASSYDNLGIVFDLQGNYREALDYYFKALRLREAVGDTAELTNSLCNIGIMYYYLSDYEKAREYQEKNLELSKAIKDLRGEGIAYNNLGSISKRQGNAEQAITYYRNALKIFESSGERHAITDTHIYMADLFIKQGKTGEAKSHLDKALSLGEDIQYSQGVANASLGLGKLALLLEEQNSAEKYLVKALRLGEEIGMPEIILSAAEHLSDLYKQRGDFKNAYAYHVKFKRMSDSLISRENIEHLTRLEMQHTFDIKQDSLQLEQAKRNFLQEIRLKRQQRQRNLLIGGILVLFVVLLLVYRIYRQKKKANTEKEVLLKEIHHRVKNNLQTITSLLSHQGYAVGNVDIRTAMEESQGRVQSIALIHQMLYQSENLKNINIQEYLENLVQSIGDMVQSANQQITFIVNAHHAFMDIDTAIPIGLIVNELVTNACKYAFINRHSGKIKVEINKTGISDYELIVADDGIGIPEIDLSGTPDTLGLKLVFILAKQLKGNVEFHTNHGTEIIIRFHEIMKNN